MKHGTRASDATDRPASPVSEVRAPARIDLAGGTLDIFPISQLEPGAVTVNMAIDRYGSARVRARDDDRWVLAATDRRTRTRLDGAAALAADTSLPLHREVALHVGPRRGAEITTRSGVPVGSGLGGSSTLVVAMLLAASDAAGKRLGKTRLLRIATDLEARVIGVPTGAQDHVGALYGGLSAITYPPGGTARRAVHADLDAVAKRIVLVHTGLPHDSAVNNWAITRAYVEKRPQVRRHIASIADAARDLLAALESGDLDTAGQAMQAEWEARKRLAPGVTTATIEAIGSAVSKAGALGMKVCGAGGGGCVAIWAAEGRRAAIGRAARESGGRLLRYRPSPGGATFV